ncbi:enoyl-CoA hydratase-related protein [Seohaeicola zhoushanensis]|uniref:Enoyl-CoA hydratase n=1 Tax=Seohaeicola zhoushanensis TaxID=1569283 RepID=A0A8J3MBE4_9RHOB|nr:enoyl-CoA hydratase-related protein [Seohaeicola zhoushanensis]GHF76334.1 enoyl-CoA hydratase [Seohaeicola zhoushanensis]
MPEVLIAQDSRGVLRITLNRPERRNAITVGMMNAIREAIEATRTDKEARVIVITGAGDRAFCAGADLSAGDTPFKPDFAQLNLPFADLLRAAQGSPVPIVCAFNGACVAGGMGFLGICDFALAANTARFGMPEAKIGLFPMQIVAVLRDLLPYRLMRDLCFTGRLMSAEEALARGIVNTVCPADQLESEVETLIETLLSVSPVAARRGRYALRTMADMTFEQMIAFAETQIGPMILTEDAREGIAAFNEKRDPVWPNA